MCMTYRSKKAPQLRQRPQQRPQLQGLVVRLASSLGYEAKKGKRIALPIASLTASVVACISDCVDNCICLCIYLLI